MEHPTSHIKYKYLSEVIENQSGSDLVLLRNPQGDSTQVCMHGGHVISWRNDQGDQLLFTSAEVSRCHQAKRGGIAVCFPQFDTSDALEVNGYTRKGWIIDENPPPLRPEDYEENSFTDLLLRPSPRDLKYWPHSEVRVEGLETLDYLDNLCERRRFTEQGAAVTFESEVDRAYLGTPRCLAVLDHEKRRTFVIRKEGLPDAVVWNPWDRKAKQMPDFIDAEYRKMVCVDGAVIEKPISLKPGEEWMGRLEIEVANSSFYSENFDSELQHF